MMSKIKLNIRGKLSVLYAVVMLVLLTAFCIILYHAIAFSFKSKSKNELLTYAHKLSERFDNKTQTFTDLPKGDFNANPLYWFRIIKPDGVLYRTAPVFSILGNTVSTASIIQKSKTDYWFYEFKEEQKWFYSVVFPVNEGKQFSGWVEVVIPVSEENKILYNIAILMFSLGIAIVLLLFFSGRFLARKTLAPVEQIRKQVDAIYEKNLSQRIFSPNPSDEIGQLAGTFNLLLQRLEKAFDSQQQFIADASHELKTPITILRSHWEKLAAEKDIPYNHRIRIQSDVDELARLSALINNLLILSSPKNKMFMDEISLVDFSKLANSLYDDILVLAENKKLQIQVSIANNIRVKGDKARMYQLLLNLVDNAIKYTPQSEWIKIELHQNSSWAEFIIEDNGIGIPANNIPYVFERFYRVDKSRSRKTGGYGLGLAVCKTIVEAHNGSISIKSGKNRGTKVIVKIPLA